MPERMTLTALNAYLLLFVPVIILINLSEEYAWPRAAASPIPRRLDLSRAKLAGTTIFM
jgi:hypothetical protein